MASEREVAGVSAEERDDELAMEVTTILLTLLRDRGLRGAVHWDGCELLVSWKEAGEGAQ